MSLLTQKTIKNTVKFKGIGLHSGKIANVSLKSSKPDTGIVFKRIDLKNNNLINPNFMSVTNTSLNTTISNIFGVKVSTIEHLMGALFALGIDNVVVEIDNEEVPILDGSAKEFVEKILSVGFEVSNKPIKIIKINKKVEFKDGERYISIEPSKVNVYADDLKDILDSRTFCLFEDIEKIKQNGLAKGGSLENALVVKDEKILNKDGLRNPREFVNHKILDCIKGSI